MKIIMGYCGIFHEMQRARSMYHDYHTELRPPTTLEEAWTLNQNKRSRVIGGMLWLRLGNGQPHTAIDLGGLGLEGITEDDSRFSIGAMTTLRELEQHPGLNAFTHGAAGHAVRDIVGVQFRKRQR